MTPKIERQFNLLAWLLDSSQPVPLEGIRERVAGYADCKSAAAFKRMFERDKEELRSMGIPLEYIDTGLAEEAKGYRIDRAKFFLPEIDFAADEAVALRLAASLIRRQPDFPYGQALDGALRKLSLEMSPREMHAAASELPLMMALSRDEPGVGRRLDVLLDALARRRTVGFRYRAPGAGRAAKRRADPYGVFYRHGGWYLVGRCHARNEPRVFKVDRMTGVSPRTPEEAPGADYEIPADFELAQYCEKAVWELGAGGQPTEARLVFSKDLAPVMDRELAGKARVRRLRDGRLEARLAVDNEDLFLRWVLGFGEGCELLEPDRLRGQLKSRLRAVAKLHAGAAGESA